MKKYLIEIEYITNHKFCSNKPIQISLTTDDIEKSMEQYQRNRNPFNWKIIEE
tara:strand:+ start:803 stop:961 length:159 start_codon:yes stop_codon:yes gene_type:complete